MSTLHPTNPSRDQRGRFAPMGRTESALSLSPNAVEAAAHRPGPTGPPPGTTPVRVDDVALGARIAPPPGVGAEADSVYVVAAINTRGSARFVRAHDAMNPARSVEFYAPRNGTMDAYPTPGWRQRRAERRAAKGHHS